MPLFGGPSDTEISKTIRTVFERRDWKWGYTPAGDIETGMNGVSMIFNYDESRRTLVILCPQVAWARDSGDEALSEAKLTRVLELLGKANYDLLLGRFGRDTDGEINYAMSLLLIDSSLNEGTLLYMMRASSTAVNVYGPEIAAIISGDDKPSEPGLSI